MRQMKVEHRPNVQIGNAVSIGHHKVVVIDVFFDDANSAPGHSFQTCVRHRHVKVLLGVSVMVSDPLLLAETDGEVIVHGFVIKEILLNHLPSVAQAEYEVTKARLRVDLHYVPEYRATADFQQR